MDGISFGIVGYRSIGYGAEFLWRESDVEMRLRRARPMADIAVNEAHRNAYPAVTETPLHNLCSVPKSKPNPFMAER
ncbi:MAG: hypothetical protein NC417_05475 [Candidatus Gastranaerophilales bacterium]|nr:hypothetical protein [Candidatus Gastranaerophilales bacterium]